MVYYDKKVLIPDGTIITKKGNKKYVKINTSSSYSKAIGYTLFKRVYLGVVIDSTYMYPNDYYLKNYKDPTIELVENDFIYSDTISIGNFILIDKIFSYYGLDQIIDSIFLNKASLVKSLITYTVASESTVAQHFKYYAYGNMHYMSFVPSEATISSLYNDYITSSTISNFLESWTSNIMSRLGTTSLILSIDSTNMNVHSHNISIAEYGKAKDDEGLSQVNLAYAIDHNTGIPLYFDLYPGSIIDNSQCKQMVEKAWNYKIKDVCLVMDRGYFSQKNIEQLDSYNYNFMILVRIAPNSILHKVIEEYRRDITNNSEYFILDHLNYGVKLERKIFDKYNKKYYLYLYYDDERASSERRDFNRRIELFFKQLKNVKVLTEEVKRTYQGYIDFTVDDKNNIINMSVNKERQQEVLDNAGYFIIVSNLDKTLEEVLTTYRKRDVIEKVFKMIKSNLDSNKYNAQNDEALNSKVLISFISSIVRSQIAYLSNEYLKMNSKETVNTILGELGKICISKNPNVYQQKYALTKTQKDILKAYEIDQKYIDDKVLKFNKSL